MSGKGSIWVDIFILKEVKHLLIHSLKIKLKENVIKFLLLDCVKLGIELLSLQKFINVEECLKDGYLVTVYILTVSCSDVGR
jgi:hypothetical protein